MSWQDEATITTRGLIGDFMEPYAYCDDRIFDLFILGSKMVTNEILFDEGFIVTLSNNTISPSPDPSSPLIVLSALKAAYIIANSEYKAKAAGAVSISDGPSQITLTGAATAFKLRVDQLGKDYNHAKLQFVIGNGYGMKVVLSASQSPYICSSPSYQNTISQYGNNMNNYRIVY